VRGQTHGTDHGSGSSPSLPQAVFPWYTLVHPPEGADEITTYPGRWPRQTATKTTHSPAGSGPGEGRNASTRRILYIGAGSRPSRWHGWATGEQFTTTTTPPTLPKLANPCSAVPAPSRPQPPRSEHTAARGNGCCVRHRHRDGLASPRSMGIDLRLN
jgi:hypothetical protein